MERQGFTNAEKKRMLLSRETLLGLRITSKHTQLYYAYMSKLGIIAKVIVHLSM